MARRKTRPKPKSLLSSKQLKKFVGSLINPIADLGAARKTKRYRATDPMIRKKRPKGKAISLAREGKEEKPQSAGRRGSYSAKASIQRATRVNRSSNKRR